jgi:hypothetical protein
LDAIAAKQQFFYSHQNNIIACGQNFLFCELLKELGVHRAFLTNIQRSEIQAKDL